MYDRPRLNTNIYARKMFVRFARKNYAPVEINLKRRQKRPLLTIIYNLLGTKIFVFLDVVPITFLTPHSQKPISSAWRSLKMSVPLTKMVYFESFLIEFLTCSDHSRPAQYQYIKGGGVPVARQFKRTVCPFETSKLVGGGTVIRGVEPTVEKRDTKSFNIFKNGQFCDSLFSSNNAGG